jgi:diadenosine tetraphosphate (Ap4A) HIT family hydrolase
VTRFIAIDWSGAKSGERSKIWCAEVEGGRLLRLESGRSREEVIAHLVIEAQTTPDLVVGLDFAFSFPTWFVASLGISTADALWSHATEAGEDWLDKCDPPFWGRPGRRRPELSEHFRATEVDAGAAGPNPKSAFQIGGAGAVGTGSIRGMPHLKDLRAGGFAIWPFHTPTRPLVLEIYPRLLTGPVNKSSQADREKYLSSGFPEIDDDLLRIAASSEDAFDAAVSAVVMARHSAEIDELAQARDETQLIEGRIWWPVEFPRATSSHPASGAAVSNCAFCGIPSGIIVAESRHAVAIADLHPVSRGHTLVLPRAHGESLYAHSGAVQQDVWELVRRTRRALNSELAPDGFNIGVNDGVAAGQTVPHAHVHVIPRFAGDAPDPRGGVRWVIPDLAPYWWS